MSRRNFADFISAYLEYTSNQETNEKVHRWVAFSIMAGAIGRKTYLARGHYTLFPNLYVFIIGPSGIVRKSTSTGIGVELLRSLDTMRIMSERLTAASLILQLERAHEKYQDKDAIEHQQSSVFAYASELIVFLGEVYGSISELLTTFFDCSPHDDSKPWTYENKSEGQKKIFGPCLNILGASTPTWLTRCIPQTEMEGGFASRVIFVVENDPPRKFIAWPERTNAINAMKPRLVEDLRQIHTLTGEMLVTPEARAWYEDWYREHTISLVQQQDLRFSGYYGRKSDTLLKVAMLCSVSESNSLKLEERHLDRAVGYMEQLERTMFQAFGTTGRNELAEDQKRVLAYMVGRRVPALHAEILRQFAMDLNHRTLVEVMSTLMNAGYVKGPPQVTRNGLMYELTELTLELYPAEKQLKEAGLAPLELPQPAM